MKPILTDDLLRLLQKISEHYQLPQTKRKRGRQPCFSDLSFLLLAIVAVVTKTFGDAEFFRLLQTDLHLRQVCGFSRLGASDNYSPAAQKFDSPSRTPNRLL